MKILESAIRTSVQFAVGSFALPVQETSYTPRKKRASFSQKNFIGLILIFFEFSKILFYKLSSARNFEKLKHISWELCIKGQIVNIRVGIIIVLFSPSYAF